MGYITRIRRLKLIYLPQESDDITNQLLTILKLVYQARLTMEHTNNIIRKYVVNESDLNRTASSNDTITACFHSSNKRKYNKV